MDGLVSLRHYAQSELGIRVVNTSRPIDVYIKQVRAKRDSLNSKDDLDFS